MSKSREILVLQAGAEELRLASALLSAGKVVLSHAATFSCAPRSGEAFALRDQLVLDELKSHVTKNGWVGRDVICLVGGPSVACSYFDFPPLRDAALRQAVVLKLGQQLHFDVNQSVVAVQPGSAPISRNDKQIRVQVTAAEGELVNAALDAISTLGLRLKALSATPSAIGALASEVYSGKSDYRACLHLDEKCSTLIVLYGSAAFVTCELPIGAADFTAALMRPIISGDNVIQLDAAGAKALRNEIGIPTPDQEIATLQMTGERLLPLLEPVLQKLAKQITQWLAFASTCNGNVPISSLVLTGQASGMAGLVPAMASRLGLSVVDEDWLATRARLGDGMDGFIAGSFAATVAAATSWSQLPDLVPAPVRRQQRIGRIRRVVTAGGFAAAAALFGFGISLGSVERDARAALTRQEAQHASVEKLLGQNAKWAAARCQTQRLAAQLDEFVRSTPSWVGVFKELSLMLPNELKALEYNSRPIDTGIQLVIKAGVYPQRSGRTFDEIVAQAVLLLQRSAFFKRVEMSANRGPATEDARSAGIVSIQLDLAYPKAKAKV